MYGVDRREASIDLAHDRKSYFELLVDGKSGVGIDGHRGDLEMGWVADRKGYKVVGEIESEVFCTEATCEVSYSQGGKCWHLRDTIPSTVWISHCVAKLAVHPDPYCLR